jgi:hypothetical protein
LSSSSSWSAFSHASRAEQRRVQDAALRRYVREELYPFSAHYRHVFDEAKVSPRDLRTVGDLRRLPLSTKQELLAALNDPARWRELVLIPSPAALASHWPFARKLARSVAGQSRAVRTDLRTRTALGARRSGSLRALVRARCGDSSRAEAASTR